MNSPVVNIKEGKVQGNQRTNIAGEQFYSFLGIPFAKPPIGTLRFKAPEPIEPWTGVKDATKDGEPCFQRNEFSFTIEGTEAECLHLNVYTKTLPSEDQQLKPVMVFIHGGAFMTGSNRSNIYGPEHLMSEEIVLVAINYRVGFLGFLHLNDTTLDVPGNAGLKDQQLALKWVQNNIKNFNGDPNNVTIFGESAGGASVHFHIVSPSSKGLFHKAIMQSGTVHNPWPYSNDVALEFVQIINKDVKSEKEALELLRSLPVTELFDYQEKFCKIYGMWGVSAPNIEYPNQTAFVTAPPAQLISSGQYNKVPIMLGYNAREGLLFEAVKNLSKANEVETNEGVDLEKLIYPQLNLTKDDPKKKLILKKYEDFYFKGENAKDKVMLLTDFFFVAGIIGSAKQHAKTSPNPVYLYRMSIDAGLNVFKKITKINEPGVCHADDLGYLFNMPIAAEFVQKGPLEEKTIRRFSKMWTNFAKTGNPTPEGNNLNVTWKPISEKEMNFLDIGEELTLQKNPEPERINLWREIFELSPNTANYL